MPTCFFMSQVGALSFAMHHNIKIQPTLLFYSIWQYYNNPNVTKSEWASLDHQNPMKIIPSNGWVKEMVEYLDMFLPARYVGNCQCATNPIERIWKTFFTVSPRCIFKCLFIIITLVALFDFFHCVFSNVSSKNLGRSMHCSISCNFIFPRYTFSNVSSNCLLEKVHSHTSCICLAFCHCVSSNVFSKY